MTLDEAQEICNGLTKTNISIWSSHGIEKENLRAYFKAKYRSVIEAGFKIRRWRKNGNPMFTARADKHRDDVAMMKNNSGYKNDCTTRCISLCTGIDYNLIRSEQLHNAAQARSSFLTWRHDMVWEKSLLSRGFIKVKLMRRHVSRATFLKLAKTCNVHDGIIATVSSGHVAAIDMSTRKIMDTWNSSGGRITCIYVPKSQSETWFKWLYDIGCIYSDAVA